MSQVIPTKSGAAIGVLLGGTGRAPATTCKPVVLPMLLKPWPGAQLDSTTTSVDATSDRDPSGALPNRDCTRDADVLPAAPWFTVGLAEMTAAWWFGAGVQRNKRFAR
jgi:hypothetical protein